MYGTKDSPQKRSTENIRKSESIQNKEINENIFLANAQNQEHKNRQAHGTDQEKKIPLNNLKTSQTTKSTSNLNKIFFENSLMKNVQDYDGLNSNSRDYINEFLKENSLYDKFANEDEDYLEDSYEYKITNGDLVRDGKFLPSSERSSILEFKYSSKVIKSLSVRFKFNFYTQIYLLFFILFSI